MRNKWFIALGIVGLVAGCSASQRMQASGRPVPREKLSQAYSLQTPIETIAADPRGAAILNKDIPGLLTNPNYGMFKSMNLKQLASLSSGRLSEQTLAQTKADLAALRKEASRAR